METVAIYAETELVEGGCNACRTTTTLTYNLEYQGEKIALSDLDVLSLLSGILRFKGYNRQQEYDALEDYEVFVAPHKRVELFETYSSLRFVASDKELMVSKKQVNHQELFETVNRILVEVFQEDAYEWTIDI